MALITFSLELRSRNFITVGENDNIDDTTNASFARKQLVNAPCLEIKFIKNRAHRLAQFEWPVIRESIVRM